MQISKAFELDRAEKRNILPPIVPFRGKRMAFLPPLPFPLPSHPHFYTYSPNPSPLTCQKSPSEPSLPLPPTTLPQNLTSTTIFHTLPFALPYLSPSTHPSDNDTLLLALSLPRSNPWLRARYIRTKPFILESRVKKKIYRGLHGTPAEPGINAPSKPKNLPKGVASVDRKLVVWGRNLPLRINPRDLVTRGETALGDVLTEGELIDERGTEVVSIVACGACRYILSLARNPAGKVLRSFVVRAGGGHETKRLCTLNAFAGREIAVSGEYVFVMGWKVGDIGGVAGVFKGFFGGKEDAPRVDVGQGSEVIVLKNRQIVCKAKVDGLLSGISIRVTGDRMEVHAVRLRGGEITLTTVESVRSGEIFMREGDLQSGAVVFDIELGNGVIGKVRQVSEEGLEVLDAAKLCDCGKEHHMLYILYDHRKNRIGLCDGEDGRWYADSADDRLSGALLSPDHSHVSVLLTDVGKKRSAKMLFFECLNVSAGAVAEIVLEGLPEVCTSTGGVWTNWDFEWSEENAKIVKSAYELFAEKDWNDIESGFSSLGLRM